MGKARFCHLTVDAVDKEAYVWHEADWKFSEDWHTHHMGQLIYVEKGVQYLHTENRTYLLPTHHCAWIPPGVAHRSSSPASQVYLRCLFFTVNEELPFFKELNIFHTPKVLREMIFFTEQWSRLEEKDPVEFDFLKGLKSILPLSFKQAIPLALPVPRIPVFQTWSATFRTHFLYSLNQLRSQLSLTFPFVRWNACLRRTPGSLLPGMLS